MHGIIQSCLLFVIKHKWMDRFFSRWKWYHELLYEEAQRVIGNR